MKLRPKRVFLNRGPCDTL